MADSDNSHPGAWSYGAVSYAGASIPPNDACDIIMRELRSNALANVKR